MHVCMYVFVCVCVHSSKCRTCRSLDFLCAWEQFIVVFMR